MVILKHFVLQNNIGYLNYYKNDILYVVESRKTYWTNLT